MSLTVVGSVAFDALETPFGKRDRILGGAATHFSLSASFFTTKGNEFVSKHYFMNLDSAKYEAYPKGQKDNTHLQPEGAKAVAQLVYNELKNINRKAN